MAKKIKVVHKKLGRNRAWGMSSGRGKVEIDPRMKYHHELKILIHETLHETYPFINEQWVIKAALVLANTLYDYGYRKVAPKK